MKIDQYNRSLEEFRQLSDRIKDYRQQLYRHIMLYLIFSGSMIAFFLVNLRDDPLYLIGFPFVGVGLTILFYAIEYRMKTYTGYYYRRAKDIEQELGFDIYTSRPNPGKPRLTNIFLLTYLFCCLMWILLPLASYLSR